MWINGLLALQFAVIHSLILLPATRRRLNRWMPAEFYGCFFCAATCVSLLVTFADWQTILGLSNVTLNQITSGLRFELWTMLAVPLLLVATASSADSAWRGPNGSLTDLGAPLMHVKPHGALYNDAIGDAELADIIARVTAEAPSSPALMGMANTELDFAAQRHGLRFVAEAFIDRAYEPDGTLVSRTEHGAVHEDLNVATTQAVRLATEGRVTARSGEQISVRADTLCIHGDTPGAAAKARAVRDVLESHGVNIRAHSMR